MSERINDRIDWTVQDGVARASLAYGRGNALDMPMAEAILAATDRIAAGAADGSIRVAVLAAAGPVFCVGGDLRSFADADDRAGFVRREADILHRAILTLRAAPIPVVSVVHGTVAGGGIGVALAADVVLMAAEATMRLAYTAVGLSPDCGTSWLLAQRVGSARAADFALTNRDITGAQAADWGLVSRAVPSADLDATAGQIIAGLRRGPTAAYAATKRLLAAAPGRDLAEQLDDEAATVSQMAAGATGTEGINAFLGKRAPDFG